MALWNNIMSMPLGQTGYSVKAADDTKFTLERVDPRIFMMGSAGGISGGARASSSKKDSEDELKPFKSTAKAEWDILQIENSIKMEEKALEQEYINKMSTLDLKDPDRITYEREFAERMNGISQKKLNIMMLKNQAGYEREKVDQFKAEIKNNSNDLAFLVDMGSITHEGDLKRLIFQDGGAGEIAHTTRLGRPETLQEYVDGYNTTWSGLTNRGLLNEFKRPYAEIDTDIQYNKHISDIVKSRASNLRQVFQPLIDIGDQNVLDAIISSSIHGVDFPYLELHSNIEPMKEIINDIWGAVPESSRARIMSDVLKMGVAIPQIDPKDGKEKLMYMSGTKFLDELHKAAFVSTTPLPKDVSATSDEGIKFLAAKEEAEKYLEKLDKALLSTAKDKMIRDAYGTSIGLDKIEYKINEFSTRQQKANENIPEATQLDLFYERLITAGVGENRIISYNSTTGQHELIKVNGPSMHIDVEFNRYIKDKLKIGSDVTKNETLSQLLGGGFAVVNSIPIATSRIDAKGEGKGLKVHSVGSIAMMLPTFENSPTLPYVLNAPKGGGMEAYIEVRLQATKGTNFKDLEVPVHITKSNGTQTVEFKKIKDIRAKGADGSKYAYTSLNLNEEEEMFSIYIPLRYIDVSNISSKYTQQLIAQTRIEQEAAQLEQESLMKSNQASFEEQKEYWSNWTFAEPLKNAESPMSKEQLDVAIDFLKGIDKNYYGKNSETQSGDIEIDKSYELLFNDLAGANRLRAFGMTQNTKTLIQIKSDNYMIIDDMKNSFQLDEDRVRGLRKYISDYVNKVIEFKSRSNNYISK